MFIRNAFHVNRAIQAWYSLESSFTSLALNVHIALRPNTMMANRNNKVMAIILKMYFIKNVLDGGERKRGAFVLLLLLLSAVDSSDHVVPGFSAFTAVTGRPAGRHCYCGKKG